MLPKFDLICMDEFGRSGSMNWVGLGLKVRLKKIRIPKNILFRHFPTNN